MIVLSVENRAMIVLEPDNVERIKKGMPISLDLRPYGDIKYIGIAYSPDVEWLSEQVMVDPSVEGTNKAIHESLTRPEKKGRPYHKPINLSPTPKERN